MEEVEAMGKEEDDEGGRGELRVQVRDVTVHSSQDRRYPGQWCLCMQAVHVHNHAQGATCVLVCAFVVHTHKYIRTPLLH